MTVRPRVLRTPQAAEYVGLSPHTLENLRSAREGPAFFKLGRVVVYEIAELDRWFDGQREPRFPDGDSALSTAGVQHGPRGSRS